MDGFLALSLLDSPIPNISWVLAAGAILFLLARPSRRWWLLALASALLAALLSMSVAWSASHVFFWWSDELPGTVIAALAMALWALFLGSATAFAGLRRPKPSSPARRRRILAVTAAMLVFAVAGLQVNAYYGDYPTVGSLLGVVPTASVQPLPATQHAATQRFMTTPVAGRWEEPGGLPSKGSFIAAEIPGTLSGFVARDAIIYLPPAYSALQRPVLPVLVLVSGQPGSPESWLRSTNLVRDLDEYAAAHGGLAPLVVMPDPNGSDRANTLCMDSDIAKAGTYMSAGVPAWINTHLDADANPAHWSIGGFSYGATCSLQMVTRHPGLFQTFMAISPEREPALAAQRQRTIDRAFNGDAEAFDNRLPLTLLGKMRYPQIHGWFAAGSSDLTYSANVKVLEAAAQKAGMTTEGASFPGGHSWAVANEALKPGLQFVYARIGLP